MSNKYRLRDRLPQSVLRMHKRGLRRYFPIEVSEGFDVNDIKTWSEEDWSAIVFLMTGKEISNWSEENRNWIIGCLLGFQSIDKYVEAFDNRVWIRTVYQIDSDEKSV